MLCRFAKSEGAQQPQDEKDHADASSYSQNWPKPVEVLLRVVLVHGNALRCASSKAHLIWDEFVAVLIRAFVVDTNFD